jgi:cell division protein FtsA
LWKRQVFLLVNFFPAMSKSNRGNFLVGLDIGSSSIRTVIAQEVAGEDLLRVVGVGSVPALGIRRGAVVDIEEAVQAVNASVEQAETMAGVAVRDVTVSVGGADIFSQDSKGVVAVGKADGEVLEDDVQRVLQAAQSISLPLNKEILHVLPKSYRLDDQKNIKDPLGMHGVRLEADALIIGGSSPHLKNIARCVEQAGMTLGGTVVEPLASALAVLNKKQKELGVAVVNIGSATTSLAVFEEGDLLHAAILPVGAAHITNDIAIGLRTSIDVAEQVKLHFGTALPEEVDKREDIDLSHIDSQEEGLVSRHHVAEIIEARLEEIFHFANAELKAIGRSGLLPAGVVLTGGGSKLLGAVELAKEAMRLPTQVGYPQALGGILDKVDDPEFATAIGLLLWAREHAFQGHLQGDSVFRGLPESLKGAAGKMRHWFDKFLP